MREFKTYKKIDYSCNVECAPKRVHNTYDFIHNGSKRKTLESYSYTKELANREKFEKYFGSLFIIGMPNDIEAKFKLLSSKWREETKFTSTMKFMSENRNYKEIVKMGVSVLPFIFEEIKKPEKRRWLLALHDITGANPVNPSNFKDVDAIAEDWIRWGRLGKYIL